MKLLIVDDSDLIRASLRGLLEGIPGIDTIHMAGTLAESLECVRQHEPSFVILDLHLPDGNAIQVIGGMRQLVPGLQIAMLTNDANLFNRRKCIQAGASWFFDKSTEFEKVIELIQDQCKLNTAPVALKGHKL